MIGLDGVVSIVVFSERCTRYSRLVLFSIRMSLGMNPYAISVPVVLECSSAVVDTSYNEA